MLNASNQITVQLLHLLYHSGCRIDIDAIVHIRKEDFLPRIHSILLFLFCQTMEYQPLSILTTIVNTFEKDFAQETSSLRRAHLCLVNESEIT